MRLLLDTHIWLWGVLDPGRLSDRVAKELENPESELWLSPISIWELLILHEKKRVLPGEEIDHWISRAMRALPLKEAPVTYRVAREIAHLHLPHRDPADHFLIATAKVFELTLVTADAQLIDTPGISVLPNT